MTHTSHLAETAAAYDAVAELYTELTWDELRGQPLDRAMFAAFAELTRDTGPVLEVGCGPGRIVAHLHDLGLEVSGVDLSPAMIDIARRTRPGLRFEVGSMDALETADGGLAGLVSWYSVIHSPPETLPGYFAEFRRVLRPGGHLLLGFFEAEAREVTAFDHRVVTAYRWPIDGLREHAREAGFTEIGRMSREPHGDERPFRHGRLLLRLGGPA
ncbi:methyltransferase family protein [Stackebrandtia albiflava]|uniref:Methyltransferase family protein n=1 Tax=Stackebrandtia albiflava TaxID=406432 RepID=A0A562V296_9ACTN|nr:class I SAM-dependent methyltransferase [Stackebrandtia albiflava]TWJ11998.1 methyltransferase family protein [Stackebrandtia albiflava]